MRECDDLLPCLDQVKVLASIGSERISLIPDVPTVSELVPELNLVLWNGLFVHKDTPQDARKKIIASAKKVIESDAAKKLAKETGALVYWQDVEAAAKQIDSDIAALEVLGKIFEK